MQSRIIKVLVCTVVILFITACGDSDELPSFTTSTFYVFGDSLSDVGNASIATSGLVPDKNYYNGRFTNGPNFADQLAGKLNAPLKPSRSFGSNYAFGGATSVDVSAQVSNYKTNADDQARADALYVVWSGGNDLLEILQDPQTSNTVDTAITHIENAVRKLSQMGAQNILVPNQPDLGNVPRVVALEQDIPGVAATATALTVQFNTALDTMLNRISTDESIDTIRFDVFTLFEDVVANPGTYGLSNVTDACYIRDETSLGLTGEETICVNSASFLFWDSLHPSHAAHTIIADEMFGVLNP